VDRLDLRGLRHDRTGSKGGERQNGDEGLHG
jgi:hypothetical protein